VSPPAFSLHIVDEWNDSFFLEFADFARLLYQNDPYALDEDVSELKKIWGPGSLFGRHFRAYLLRDSNGKTCARALVSVGGHEPAFIALGYYERVSSTAGLELLRRIEQDILLDSRYRGKDQRPLHLRGPLQGHFFNSYRLRLQEPADHIPFFGEPRFPAAYADDFIQAGFEELGRWRSVEITREQAQGSFDRIWKATESRWNRSGVRIRSLEVKKWPQELRGLFDLLADTFKDMPNFEPISWPAFEMLFKDLSYLLEPGLVLFAEKDGETQGFVVAIKDPLPVLLKLQKKTRAWPWLKKIFQLQALGQLKKNRGRLLVLYIGKKPSSPLPWLGAALGKKITDEGIRQGYTSALICYLAEKSPIFTSLPSNLRTVSHYVLFQKEMSS
jgi:hypothetical protein